MELTNAQKTTLRNFVTNDVTLNAIPKTPDGAFALADALNVVNNPAFTVWRSTMSTSEMFDAVVWTAVDGLTVGKARIFEWMQTAGTIKPEVNNIRTAITQCFGASSASEVAILALMKRSATVLEKLLANTGGGDGSVATPAKLRVEGNINYVEVLNAMGW